MKCLAHTINLAVQKGLNLIQEKLQGVKKIVGFFRRSTSATTLLEVGILTRKLGYFVTIFYLLNKDVLMSILAIIMISLFWSVVYCKLNA